MLSSRTVRFILLILSGIILLSACAGDPPAPQQVSEVQVSATALATSTSTPAASPTPSPSATPTAVPTATPSPTPTQNPVVDPITGAPALARGQVAQRPYIVMIDNHPDAYPQTGMEHAAVVFEALAEFGVTRFMVVYAPGITPDVEKIGPIRSTRLYFAQWAMGFHSLYVHAGGSPQGLALVESTDQLINLDSQYEANLSYVWRSKDRVAPHNLYTSTDRLSKVLVDRNVTSYDHPEVGYLFKDDAPAAERPDSESISYFFIYPEDPAGWKYDPQTNGYLRLRRGAAARDAADNQQLWTKNVVVMEVSEERIAGDDKGRIDQEVIGSGEARVFMDGVERTATWRKDDEADMLRFFDASGNEIELNRGPVWIAALPNIKNLTVK